MDQGTFPVQGGCARGKDSQGIMKLAGELDDRWLALSAVVEGETLRRRASG